LATIDLSAIKGCDQENESTIDNHQFGAKVDNLRGVRQFGRKRKKNQAAPPGRYPKDDNHVAEKPRKELKK